MIHTFRVVAIIFIACCLLACDYINSDSAKQQLEFENWQIRPAANLDIYAGFGTIINRTENDLILQTVNSEFFDEIAIHKTILKDNIYKMRLQDTVKLASDSKLDFKPGGLHLMLFEQVFENRETALLQFVFNNGESVTITAQIDRDKNKNAYKPIH